MTPTAHNSAIAGPRTHWGGLLWLTLTLLCALAVWGYVGGVLIPYKADLALRSGQPHGNLSDLYPRWLGSRELLRHGSDPYSPAVTRQIQTGFYGQPLDPANPADRRDPQAFAYPVYVAFLLAPLLGGTFADLQAPISGLLAALTMMAVPLWCVALGLRLPARTLLGVALLTVSSFAGVTGVVVQQPSLALAFVLAAALALLVRGYGFPAGVLLALTTIKPHLVAPVLAGLLLWSLRDLRRRQGWLWGFAGTFGALCLGAEVLLPGWVPKFLLALTAYPQYTGSRSPLLTLLGPWAGGLVIALLLVGLSSLWWRAGAAHAPAAMFGHALALTLSLTLLMIPLLGGYNQVLLLPALLLLLADGAAAWRQGGRALRYCYVALGAVLVWYPLVTLALVGAAAVAAWQGAGLAAQTMWEHTWYTYTLPVIPFLIPPALVLTFYRRPLRLSFAGAAPSPLPPP